MYANFQILWNCLSLEGLEDRFISKELIGEKLTPIPLKLSKSVTQYPGIKVRTPEQADLHVLSEFVLEDIGRIRDNEFEPLFLRECYCQSGALSRYSEFSKQMLAQRYFGLFGTGTATEPVREKRGIKSELKEPKTLLSNVSKRPVILVGDVGVGKTSFIHYLWKVEAADEIKNALVIFIDLLNAGTLTPLDKFVLDEVVHQLADEYSIDIFEDSFVRGIYHSELKKFERRPIGRLKSLEPEQFLREEIKFLNELTDNLEHHIIKSLEHIQKAWKKQTVIFIDNADHRSIEDQERAFLISADIASNWAATVFVPLRPDTFDLSSKRGVLTAYHPKSFTIDPPRVDEVISKRIDFALKITSGEISPYGYEQITLSAQKLESLLKCFKKAFEEREEIKEFIVNVSGENIREALELIRYFFGSPYLNIGEITRIIDEFGMYTFTLRHFLKAIIFWEYSFFNPESKSPITNIFGIYHSAPNEHFLLPIIIFTLYDLSSRAESGGFVELEQLYGIVQAYGYTADQINAALLFGTNKKLIQTTNRVLPDSDKKLPPTLRATQKALYHITKLASNYEYMDAIIIDTPIYSHEYRSKIAKVIESKDIEERLHKTEQFRAYLDKIWSESSQLKESPYQWPALSKALKDNLAFIKSKVTQQSLLEIE